MVCVCVYCNYIRSRCSGPGIGVWFPAVGAEHCYLLLTIQTPLWGPPSFVLDAGGSTPGRWSGQVAHLTTNWSTADVKKPWRCTSTPSILVRRREVTRYFVGTGFSADFHILRHFLRTNALITADSRRVLHPVIHHSLKTLPTDTNCADNIIYLARCKAALSSASGAS
jgi:hypothetical protein